MLGGVGWLLGLLACWLAGWLAGLLACWLAAGRKVNPDVAHRGNERERFRRGCSVGGAERKREREERAREKSALH